MKNTTYSLGIDLGSTTVKVALLDQEGNVLFGKYLRHGSKARDTLLLELDQILVEYGDIPVYPCMTGSSGLSLSKYANVPFVQEVESSFNAIKALYPKTDSAIELGGEDAKIIFVTGGVEERMNGQCAGGTGAFIDQMATLLCVDAGELSILAGKAEKAYPIASRCGVFAKSDIQSILNQGASKEDVARSIFYAVADQTIAGLAQGREIKGNVLFLGGPLHFLPALREAFRDRLGLDEEHAFAPKEAPLFVAIGAGRAAKAISQEPISLSKLITQIHDAKVGDEAVRGAPLFHNEKEYQDFLLRHKDVNLVRRNIQDYEGPAYLGIDEGSTTTKLVLLSKDNEILYQHYQPNEGLPLDNLLIKLKEIYAMKNPRCEIVASAVTGYGEELIKSAFGVDYGLVETLAHLKAASYFEPDVEFILDIGGQDIKCFKVNHGVIDSIMLNEACSSGCGSFLSSLATSLGYDLREFVKLGYYGKAPVELGSRCTVFMNSSIKQAQREGAGIEDISAGLARSIVKNALYKVIRVSKAEDLGHKIVVQGGTFLNDAVLRAFEQEIGFEVIRPSIAGLMGAFGAALYAKEKGEGHGLLSKEELDSFSYKSQHLTCRGCTAHCSLSLLRFPGGKKFISGNKCGKPEGKKDTSGVDNIFAWKRDYLTQKVDAPAKPIGKVGLPLALCMYEQLPLWKTFFRQLGFEVVVSPFSTRAMYRAGQKSIPSDTACYPAKLFHGHVDYLLQQGVDFIFYPSESYNVNENRGDNHFHCPVVAYYGELLKRNDTRLNDKVFRDPFLLVDDVKPSVKTLLEALKDYPLGKKEVEKAFVAGYQAMMDYREATKKEADAIIVRAKEAGKRLIVLCGRSYHIDPEVSHGIDQLLTSMNVALLSEDSLRFGEKIRPHVLNQWTYHARLFDAANYVAGHPEMELVQLVSFGCGVDAITTDEVREILESKGRLYTQIKIDEIQNLGAVKIRLRSLLGALEEREKHE
ncbi:MAG: 2-hydroxyacyl-CoA dehydratase [Bacilli bacterium]|nr:2-hydroxyacyl-CoA dehydratase [Bacilli bacterium]